VADAKADIAAHVKLPRAIASSGAASLKTSSAPRRGCGGAAHLAGDDLCGALRHAFQRARLLILVNIPFALVGA
jgi:hypothetical protein